MSPAVAMALIVASFIVYHAVTRSLRTDLDAMLFLLVVYGVALAGSAALAYGGPRGAGFAAYRPLDWLLAAALGLALVGIEYGFIAAYRAGWPVTLAPTFANVTLALLILPVGVLIYRDKLSIANLAGLGLCVAGLILMGRKA